MTTETPADDPTPQEMTVDAREEAQRRAQECGAKLRALLAEYRCDVAPYLKPLEPVGVDGSRALVSAAWVLIPHV